MLEDVAVYGEDVRDLVGGDLGGQGGQQLARALIGRMQVGHRQHAPDQTAAGSGEGRAAQQRRCGEPDGRGEQAAAVGEVMRLGHGT